jgi:hypothetical protein
MGRAALQDAAGGQEYRTDQATLGRVAEKLREQLGGVMPIARHELGGGPPGGVLDRRTFAVVPDRRPR